MDFWGVCGDCKFCTADAEDADDMCDPERCHPDHPVCVDKRSED